MFKKLTTSLVLSSVLSSSSLWASSAPPSNFDENDHRIRGAKGYATKEFVPQETQHWNGYERWQRQEDNRNKSITKYVESIANLQPEATAWFLTTGGKYGFRKTKATDEERADLLSAFHKVANFFNENQEAQRGFSVWSSLEKQCEEGRQHTQYLLNLASSLGKRIDALERDTVLLRADNTALKQKVSTLEERIILLTENNVSLNDKNISLNDKNISLNDKIDYVKVKHKDLKKAFADSERKAKELNEKNERDKEQSRREAAALAEKNERERAEFQKNMQELIDKHAREAAEKEQARKAEFQIDIEKILEREEKKHTAILEREAKNHELALKLEEDKHLLAIKALEKDIEALKKDTEKDKIALQKEIEKLTLTSELEKNKLLSEIKFLEQDKTFSEKTIADLLRQHKKQEDQYAANIESLQGKIARNKTKYTDENEKAKLKEKNLSDEIQRITKKNEAKQKFFEEKIEEQKKIYGSRIAEQEKKQADLWEIKSRIIESLKEREKALLQEIEQIQVDLGIKLAEKEKEIASLTEEMGVLRRKNLPRSNSFPSLPVSEGYRAFPSEIQESIPLDSNGSPIHH